MCTPTDRALAVEELEHLEHRVSDWMYSLIDNFNPKWSHPTIKRLIREMREELKK